MYKNPFQSFSSSVGVLLLLVMVLFMQGCSMFGIRTVEEAAYTVLKTEGDIEIRRYAPVMAVETFSYAEDFDAASDITFNRLFDYISGSNVSATNISMTAPVIASQDKQTKGETIAMTSPVIASKPQDLDKGWKLAFVLPKDMTPETAPQPTDPEVRLIELPEKTVAAIQYSGLWSQEKFDKQSAKLMEWLNSNNYKMLSLPAYAGYDPPWALPFLRRNEVLIDVQP